MKASLRSVRIAPKKASLVAKMIRGMSAADAMSTLERTNKKAARILEDLLRSAMANAAHNDRQNPQMLVIRTLTVNQAQAYHRGVPMARGRVRPMRKFLSHIDLTLGIAGDDDSVDAPAEEEAPTKKAASRTKQSSAAKKPETASQKKAAPVQKKQTDSTEKRKDTPKKPASSDVPAS